MIVDVLVPLAVIEAGDAEIVEVVALAAPGTKLTVSLSLIELPLTVPVIVASPDVVGDVSTAVYVPSPLSMTLLSVPDVVKSATI